MFTATTIKSATNFFSLSPQIAASFFPFASTRYAWQLPLALGFPVTIDVHGNGLCVGEIEKIPFSRLDGRVAQQQLDLFKLPARRPA